MANTPAAGSQGGGVNWQLWGQPLFAQAQRDDKPILLSISSAWCYWCRVMEETTYADPEVVNFINDNFTPALVDNDHRPDVNARYNVGGWPTTVLLTPHGGYIAGATYLPPDQMLAMLLEVRRAYAEDKPGLYDQAAQLARQRQEYVNRASSGPELSRRLVDLIARQVAGAYDPRCGGFGEAPKFPSAPVLQFLLHLFRTTGEGFYQAMLEKTLDGMLGGELYDSVEGGFYRYCVQNDWTEAQREKMLEDNVNLTRVFLDAWLLLGRPEYRGVAAQTIGYLQSTLYHPETAAFRGSQGAHSDYFGLSAAARRGQAPPPADPFCYANWTCQAVSLFFEAAWKLPCPKLSDLAEAALDRVAAKATQGNLPHAFDLTGQTSRHLPQGENLLCDWAALLNALVDGYNCRPQRSDYLTQAIAAAAELEQRFYDPSRGGFFDVQFDPEAAGYLQVREKPLPENAMAAVGLLKLYQATQDMRYMTQAENTLSAFVESHRDYGEHAAAFAAAVDLFLHPPVEITIEGSAERVAGRTGAGTDDAETDGEAAEKGEDGMGVGLGIGAAICADQSAPEDLSVSADYAAMVRAAARISHPHLTIKPAPAKDPTAPVLAHVCRETLCFPPVSEPDSLANSVAEALTDQDHPTMNIFERFAGL